MYCFCKRTFAVELCIPIPALFFFTSTSLFAQISIDPILVDAYPFSLQEVRESGPGHPWQQKLPGINPYSGAKITSIHLVSWRTRGGMGVTLSLNHNSKSKRGNPALGNKWRHSYDIELIVGSKYAVMIWGDHRMQIWEKIGNQWKSIDVYHDELEIQGSSATVVLDSGETFSFTMNLPKLNPTKYRLTSISDNNNNTVALSYDSSNRLINVTDPVNRQLRFTYEDKKLTSIDFFVDSFFDVFFNISFDSDQKLMAVQLPKVTSQGQQKNYKHSFEYDSKGNVTKYTDPEGSEWGCGYDSKDRCIWEQWPGNSINERVTYEYTSNQIKITDPLGVFNIIRYDTVGRTIGIYDYLDRAELEFVYEGPIISPTLFMRYASGESAKIKYNDGKPTQVTDPKGNNWYLYWTTQGKLERYEEPIITDAWGNTPPYPSTTSFVYDANGNVAKVRRHFDPNNFIEYQISYNNFGCKTFIIDPKGDSWKFVYDTYFNLTKMETPEGRSIQWLFENSKDTFGYTQPNAIFDGYGFRKNLFRDEWGRLVATADSARATSFTYNGRSQPTSLWDSDTLIPTLITYNSQGVYDTIVYGTVSTLQYEYYANKLLRSVQSINSGFPRKIIYEYDNMNRRSKISDGTSNTLLISEDFSSSRIKQILHSNGALYVYDYDNGKIKRLDVHYANNQNLFIEYDFQENGRLRSVTESNPFGQSTTKYQYDALNRLIREEKIGSINYDFHWQYDANSNRVLEQEPFSGQIRKFFYDKDNLLTLQMDGFGNQLTYLYDQNGRLVRSSENGILKNIFNYSFDGQVNQIDQWNGSQLLPQTQYKYDALNRRIAEFQHDFMGNVLRKDTWIYDDIHRLQVLSEDSSQNVVDGFNFGWWGICHGWAGSSVVEKTPITDGFGSLRMLLDNNGDISNYYVAYNAYGNRIMEFGHRPPLAFQGDYGFTTEMNSNFVTGAFGMYDASLGMCFPTGPFDIGHNIPWNSDFWDYILTWAGVRMWLEDPIEIRTQGSEIVECALKAERDRIRKRAEQEAGIEGGMVFTFGQAIDANELEKKYCDESPIIQMVKKASNSEDPEVKARAQDVMDKVFPPSPLEGCVFTIDD